jgi:hypothetical protein
MRLAWHVVARIVAREHGSEDPGEHMAAILPTLLDEVGRIAGLAER